MRRVGKNQRIQMEMKLEIDLKPAEVSAIKIETDKTFLENTVHYFSIYCCFIITAEMPNVLACNHE